MRIIIPNDLPYALSPSALRSSPTWSFQVSPAASRIAARWEPVQTVQAALVRPRPTVRKWMFAQESSTSWRLAASSAKSTETLRASVPSLRISSVWRTSSVPKSSPFIGETKSVPDHELTASDDMASASPSETFADAPTFTRRGVSVLVAP